MKGDWRSATKNEQLRGLYAVLLLFSSPVPGASGYSGGLWINQAIGSASLTEAVLGVGYLLLGSLVYMGLGFGGRWLAQPYPTLALRPAGPKLVEKRRVFISYAPVVLATMWVAICLFAFGRDELGIYG